jgi:pimeloyl-ACP methyl ester carboxylesterase
MKIELGKNEWNITAFGKGDTILLAFHGYGQSHTVFEHFSKLIYETHTIWCIDLAFHGENSDINQGFQFDVAYAKELIDKILILTNKSQIGLLGYSIGGRIALSIASIVPERISEILLFAPDGLPVSKSYYFLTHTLLGDFLFKRFVKNSGLAVNLLRFGKNLKFLPAKLADYYLFEIDTHQKREQLYSTWKAYRMAIPNKKNLLNWNNKGEITCVLGKHDSVIPLNKTQKHLKIILPSSRVIVLEAGHNLLSEKAIKKLAEYF